MRPSLVAGSAILACLAAASPPNGPQVFFEAEWSVSVPICWRWFLSRRPTKQHCRLEQHWHPPWTGRTWRWRYGPVAALVLGTGRARRYRHEPAFFRQSLRLWEDHLCRARFTFHLLGWWIGSLHPDRFRLQKATFQTRHCVCTGHFRNSSFTNATEIRWEIYTLYLAAVLSHRRGLAGKIFDMKGIPGNKTIASVYTVKSVCAGSHGRKISLKASLLMFDLCDVQKSINLNCFFYKSIN